MRSRSGVARARVLAVSVLCAGAVVGSTWPADAGGPAPVGQVSALEGTSTPTATSVPVPRPSLPLPAPLPAPDGGAAPSDDGPARRHLPAPDPDAPDAPDAPGVRAPGQQADEDPQGTGDRGPSAAPEPSRGSARPAAGSTPALPDSPILCDLLRKVMAQLPPPARQDPQKVFAGVPEDVRAAVPEPLRGLILADCTRAASPPAHGGGGDGRGGDGRGGAQAPGRGHRQASVTQRASDTGSLLPHTGAAGLAAVPAGLLMVLVGRRLARLGGR